MADLNRIQQLKALLEEELGEADRIRLQTEFARLTSDEVWSDYIDWIERTYGWFSFERMGVGSDPVGAWWNDDKYTFWEKKGFPEKSDKPGAAVTEDRTGQDILDFYYKNGFVSYDLSTDTPTVPLAPGYEWQLSMWDERGVELPQSDWKWEPLKTPDDPPLGDGLGTDSREIVPRGAWAPDGLYIDSAGKYWNSLGFGVDPNTALGIIKQYQDSLKDDVTDDVRGISESDAAILEIERAKLEQRRQEEQNRIIGESAERHRLSGEFSQNVELEQQKLFQNEQGSIRDFMLQRQQTLADISARPRNWLEAIEFERPGRLPDPTGTPLGGGIRPPVAPAGRPVNG